MKQFLIVLVISALVMSMGMVTALAAPEASSDPEVTQTPTPTATPDTRSPLQKAVTEDVAGSVLDEVIGVLPVLLVALIGFIAIRKGLGFLIGLLRSA